MVDITSVRVRLLDGGGPFEGYTIRIPTPTIDMDMATVIGVIVDQLRGEIVDMVVNIEDRNMLLDVASTLVFHFCDGFNPVNGTVYVSTNCDCD